MSMNGQHERVDNIYLSTLNEILDSVAPHNDLEPSLNSILEILSKDLHFQRAFLAIMDPESEKLKLSITHSPAKDYSATYSPGKGVVGRVYETGKSVVIPRMSEDTELLNKAFNRSEEELNTLSFICVPVKSATSDEKQEVLGTLSVDSPILPMDNLLEHMQFLEVVAALISNQVSRLQEEMSMQAQMLSQGMIPGGVDAAPPADFVATSKSMKQVLRQARQVGPSRATALLRGESGTGKELLAEAIHACSPRRDKPLVKLNCAALPAELVESELFGHQKGAFTGAYQNKRGLFEVANNGTLFLDEIGELSLDAQAKVLRAIQEKEIQRVGSEQPIAVDVRLICATHQPLETLLREGRFREDLFYRINVFPIFIPPLRERREDILPLAEQFLESFASEYEKSIKRISSPAIDLFTQYHWPGNVRELKNCLERAVLICEEEVIRTYHLPPTLQTAESTATDTSLSFGEAVAKFEQELLVDSLKKARGNMLQAARDLRVSYRIVNYKVKKYNIDVKKYAGAKKKK
ncbi:sigma 54-interacting transcriptional regulator [Maridesulfovibrio hydrothermalis]|uniref:Transcriptional regulator, NifA subfamily, Fis Family n=1 Tax=Maridesulfovibrio hydrothermalis AM13 = DSM 14728 TaxID=1121451 RepID=L0R5X6_9BACT|nr:sigma 54-interacting transcriptional regulator [Maridesulfovibrio hydrothermalis]CCO22074.1 Transcriptional regulator, NifA subfamily, Fis Family [Maridesulfovibrio hydrothermalis AM13 = DSM 14728]